MPGGVLADSRIKRRLRRRKDATLMSFPAGSEAAPRPAQAHRFTHASRSLPRFNKDGEPRSVDVVDALEIHDQSLETRGAQKLEQEHAQLTRCLRLRSIHQLSQTKDREPSRLLPKIYTNKSYRPGLSSIRDR